MRLLSNSAISLLINIHLQESILCSDTLHTDCGSGARQWDTSPTKVTNGWIRGDPVALRIIEEWIGRQGTITLNSGTVRMQTDLIGLIQTEGRIVGLDARTPDPAVIRPEQ